MLMHSCVVLTFVKTLLVPVIWTVLVLTVLVNATQHVTQTSNLWELFHLGVQWQTTTEQESAS